MRFNRDDGFTLIELLIVIVILGVLAAVTAFAVGGVTASAQVRGCDADRAVLEKAIFVYQQETGQTDIEALGAGEDRFEQRLIERKLLERASKHYTVQGDGTIVAGPASSCPNPG